MPYGGGYERPYGPSPFRFGSSYGSPMGIPGHYPQHWGYGGYFPQERPYFMPNPGTWHQQSYEGAWRQPYPPGGMGGEHAHTSGTHGAEGPPPPEKPDWRGILGLGPDANVADVKKAYKAAALKCHPDRAPASATKEEIDERTDKFQKLGAAKEAAFKDLGYEGT